MQSILAVLADSQQASNVMQNIASYVIYIYPGFISIYLYNFFVARKTKDTQALILKSFAISYLYNIFIQTIFSKINFLNNRFSENSIAYNVYLIAVAFLIPYIIYRVKISNTFASICEKLKISTSVTDVPFELLGDKEEDYICMKIYLANEPYAYIGYIEEYEYEEEREKYLILTGYRKYYISDMKDEVLVAGYDADDYKEKVFIRFNDVKRIEKISENRANEIYKKLQK